MKKIYVDLDGVLTDFQAQAAKLFDMPKDEVEKYLDKNPGKTWAKISRAGADFWSKMPWMEDGKQLWDGLAIYKPIILSSPTKHPSSKIGKIRWLRENVSENSKVILDHDKAKYADEDSILIDDREKNIEAWKKAGGIGILHKNSRDTLEELSKVLAGKKTAAVRVSPEDIGSKVELGKLRGGRATKRIPPKKGRGAKYRRQKQKLWQQYEASRVCVATVVRQAANNIYSS